MHRSVRFGTQPDHQPGCFNGAENEGLRFCNKTFTGVSHPSSKWCSSFSQSLQCPWSSSRSTCSSCFSAVSFSSAMINQEMSDWPLKTPSLLTAPIGGNANCIMGNVVLSTESKCSPSSSFWFAVRFLMLVWHFVWTRLNDKLNKAWDVWSEARFASMRVFRLPCFGLLLCNKT